MADETFYVGAGVRALTRVLTVDPVSKAKTPEPAVPSITFQFLNPDDTVLATRTLGAGVSNAGNGYYHASATPVEEGLHTVKITAGTDPPGRDIARFTVDPF